MSIFDRNNKHILLEDVSANTTASNSFVANINSVKNNKTNIDIVATNISDINNVSSHVGDIETAADNILNITTVNSNSSNINTVAGNISIITNVNNKLDDIEDVVDNLTAISNVSTNIEDIQSASDYVDTIDAKLALANTYAGNASNSANSAALSAATASSLSTDLNNAIIAFKDLHVSIDMLNSNQTATSSYDGTTHTISLGIPKGDKGDRGDTGLTGNTGPSNTLTIGTVTSGTSAGATITGTSPNQVLNLILPIADSLYILPTASTTTLGGVKVDGTTITINDGVISGANTYTLPTASNSVLGGVKVDNSTITIDANGTISSHITDTITFNTNSAIARTGTISYLTISGGPNTGSGANIILNGKDRSSYTGEFHITANDGTDSISIIGKPDGTLKWGTDSIITEGNISDYSAGIVNHFIGEIIPVIGCSSSYVPENCLPCDGSEYTKAQFETLYTDYLTATTPLLMTCSYADYASDITTYGQCAKWALDTANEKFKVPTIKDGSFLQQALTNGELGKAYNAGLPYFSGTNGESDTVQPNAVTVRFFVCVAGGSVNQSQMDWAAWASSLANKLNTDFSNKPANIQYITETYTNGTSWYRIWSDGWTEQGGMADMTSTNTATVTYTKAFSDNNYTITVSGQRTSTNGFVRISDRTATTITFYFEWDTGQSKRGYCYWYACGY